MPGTRRVESRIILVRIIMIVNALRLARALEFSLHRASEISAALIFSFVLQSPQQQTNTRPMAARPHTARQEAFS